MTFMPGPGDRDFIPRFATESPTAGVCIDDIGLAEGIEFAAADAKADAAPSATVDILGDVEAIFFDKAIEDGGVIGVDPSRQLEAGRFQGRVEAILGP